MKLSVSILEGDSVHLCHLGPAQKSNFSCTEANTYLGRPE